MKTGRIDCPETPVNNYHSTLCNNPEERRSPVRRGGSLKSSEEKFTSFSLLLTFKFKELATLKIKWRLATCDFTIKAVSGSYGLQPDM